MYHTVIKHSGNLRTLVFPYARGVLSQSNTLFRLLYLSNKVRPVIKFGGARMAQR